MTGSPHDGAEVPEDYGVTLHYLKPLQDLRAVKLAREGVLLKEELLDKGVVSRG